jgi:outer membrane protein assembly factor BamA
MQVRGNFITAKIEISLKKGFNNADVIITPTKGSFQRFSGEIVPRGESKYFKRAGEM